MYLPVFGKDDDMDESIYIAVWIKKTNLSKTLQPSGLYAWGTKNAMPMQLTNIYTLSHPITNEVRYIGKADNLLKRLKHHLYHKKKNHRMDWINSLRKENLIPKIESIDIVPQVDWQFWEKYWIAQFKVWGFRLTNLTTGGEGVVGRIVTEETRKKISIAKKGVKFSEEARKNMSRGSGINRPFYGKRHSFEARKKISEKNKGHQVSDVQREKQSEYLKVKYANGYSPVKGRKWSAKEREKIMKSRAGQRRNIADILNTQTGIFYKSAADAFDSSNYYSLSNFQRKMSGMCKNTTSFINCN